MKELTKYLKDNKVLEALKINSKSKVNKDEILDPEDFKDMETPGFDGMGEELIIIGKPFKHKNTKDYVETKVYIKEKHYQIENDLEDIDDRDDYDYFVYARYLSDDELYCFTYGYEGAYALNN